MKNLIFFSLLIFTILFSSCATHVIVSYQTDNKDTGTVFITPSSATYNTSITLNNKLLINHKAIKTVTVNNVPEGIYKIDYTHNSGKASPFPNKNIITVNKGELSTQLIQVQMDNSSYLLWLLPLFLLSSL